VYPDDTEGELRERILAQEHKIYPKAIQLFAQGRLTVAGRKVYVRGFTKDAAQCLVNPPLDI
jgi:phosphoribosylglycinamide formyltransferase-1